MAFRNSGVPYDDDSFPEISFDGSQAHIPLLFHELNEYAAMVETAPTPFGNRAERIIIHPETLVEHIPAAEKQWQELEQLPEEYAGETNKEATQDTIMLAALLIAINAIASEYLNHPQDDSHKELGKHVFAQFYLSLTE